MTERELKATTGLWMDIETASAKIRDLPPGDAEEAEFPVWAGVIPIETGLRALVADPWLKEDIPAPPELRALSLAKRLRP